VPGVSAAQGACWATGRMQLRGRDAGDEPLLKAMTRFFRRPTSDGAYLILESRGGGRPPRNPDYSKALKLLLHRLGQGSAVLTDIEVYSRETIPLPIEERRITAPGFPLPLALASLSDAERERFRNELGSASAALGRQPEKIRHVEGRPDGGDRRASRPG
jgi:hypothetical protein